MRHPTFSAAGRWPIAVLLACLIAGCGVGTYNESVEQRTQSLGRAAPFTQLFGAQPIADASVTIRVPQLFKTSFQEGSADPKNPNQKIDPQRLQPPFLELPGFKLCYEATAEAKDQPGAPLTYYCYLAAQPRDGGALEIAMPARLKRAFPNAQVAWETVACSTPTGDTVSWKKIRAQGEQRFDIVPLNGPVQQKKLLGIFELWLYETPERQILVGWRIPEAIETDIHLVDPPDNSLASLAALTAGTIEQTVAAQPPAKGP
jgi:hypothetical protein